MYTIFTKVNRSGSIRCEPTAIGVGNSVIADVILHGRYRGGCPCCGKAVVITTDLKPNDADNQFLDGASS